MKYYTLIIISLVFSIKAYAADLTQDALQGDWLVVEFQGEPDSDNTKWQFKGNQFIQNLGGMRIAPDEYTTAPGLIDLGYSKIKVISFNGKVMEADMAGFKYKLVKQ